VCSGNLLIRLTVKAKKTRRVGVLDRRADAQRHSKASAHRPLLVSVGSQNYWPERKTNDKNLVDDYAMESKLLHYLAALERGYFISARGSRCLEPFQL
jgi:hypothetical protein